MKYYVIAGEPSGDLHASNMMKELLLLDSTIEFRYWGGDLMQQVTRQEPRKHIKELAFMGFVEVAKNIRTIFKNIAFCKKDILEFNPEILILVDYPGFNLRIADWAKQQGIRVFYYISPTIWAWKEDRVEIIKRSVEKMFVILPFEVAVYKRHGYQADYVGHPLLDAIDQEKNTLPDRETFLQKNKLDQRPIIAVLPGSRKQEIERMFEIMLNVVHDFKDYQFVIAGTTNLPKEAYQAAIDKNIKVVFNQTYALMHNAHAGIIKSGTSTLESALFRLPQVVCYKGGAISYSIARMVVGNRVKYIALPNLILDKPVVKELIQSELTSANLKSELTKILKGPAREAMLKEYDALIHLLGNSGASKKVAELMYNHIHAKK
ncbi:MAG: lipid-A-disaccharide synthase [Bacteroidota bacterium]|jgi:lipid-A-disaccharide synthase|nr:lipid-A-disaccharide synthase [Bacteroidota bacterium]